MRSAPRWVFRVGDMSTLVMALLLALVCAACVKLLFSEAVTWYIFRTHCTSLAAGGWKTNIKERKKLRFHPLTIINILFSHVIVWTADYQREMLHGRSFTKCMLCLLLIYQRMDTGNARLEERCRLTNQFWGKKGPESKRVAEERSCLSYCLRYGAVFTNRVRE